MLRAASLAGAADCCHRCDQRRIQRRRANSTPGARSLMGAALLRWRQSVSPAAARSGGTVRQGVVRSGRGIWPTVLLSSGRPIGGSLRRKGGPRALRGERRSASAASRLRLPLRPAENRRNGASQQFLQSLMPRQPGAKPPLVRPRPVAKRVWASLEREPWEWSPCAEVDSHRTAAPNAWDRPFDGAETSDPSAPPSPADHRG